MLLWPPSRRARLSISCNSLSPVSYIGPASEIIPSTTASFPNTTTGSFTRKHARRIAEGLTALPASKLIPHALLPDLHPAAPQPSGVVS